MRVNVAVLALVTSTPTLTWALSLGRVLEVRDASTCNRDNLFRCFTASPSVASPYCASYTSSAAATVTASTTVISTRTITEISTLVGASTISTATTSVSTAHITSTISTTITQTSTVTLPGTTQTFNKRDGSATGPACLTRDGGKSTSYPADRISSACSCLYPSPTVTVTSTSTTTVTTVSSSASISLTTTVSTSQSLTTAVSTTTLTVTSVVTTFAPGPTVVDSFYIQAVHGVDQATNPNIYLGIGFVTPGYAATFKFQPLITAAQLFNLDPSTGHVSIADGPYAGYVLYSTSNTVAPVYAFSASYASDQTDVVPLVCSVDAGLDLTCLYMQGPSIIAFAIDNANNLYPENPGVDFGASMHTITLKIIPEF